MTDAGNPLADPLDRSPGQPPSGQTPRRVLLRRAPKYRAFVLTGVLTGLAVTLVLSRFSPAGTNFSSGSTLGYLAMVLALLGAVLGAAAAVLLERPHR